MSDEAPKVRVRQRPKTKASEVPRTDVEESTTKHEELEILIDFIRGAYYQAEIDGFLRPYMKDGINQKLKSLFGNFVGIGEDA